jgi:hypothetical protein
MVRYTAPQAATRTLTVDGKPLPSFRYPDLESFRSADRTHWALAVLTDEADRPVKLHLAPGTHQLRLENPDGTTMEMDYVELIATRSAAPRGQSLIVGEFTGLVRDEDGRRVVVPARGLVHPTTLNLDEGYCYLAPLPAYYPGDGIADGPPSTLRLFENDRELGPAHAPHAKIRTKGSGQFSHWKTHLYFSASDNTDPRTNGRQYRWEIALQ